MERITIKSVLIKSFRNLKDVSFDSFDNYTIIRGNNMKGKTNTLNAIMWCICGVDLDGSNNDFANIPYELRHNCEEVVDVTVQLSCCKIRRIVDFKDAKATQRLFIDDEQFDVKAGDLVIDKNLGLLELSLQDTKDFKVRRFLLNPLYYTQCSQLEFRKWVLKLACKGTDEKAILDSCDLGDKVKNIVASGISVYGDVAKFSKATTDEIKKAKEELGHLEYALNTLHVSVETNIKNVKGIKLYAEEKQVAIKEFAEFLNNHYSMIAGRSDLRITLLEPTRDGSWTDVCYPTLLGTGTPVKFGSTAERIISSCLMVDSVRKFAKVNELPMLIDEGETLDSMILNLLNKEVHSQKVISSVSFEKTEKVLEFVGE